MSTKAYHVSNMDGYGEIVFAETHGKAKNKSSFLDFDDYIELSAKRAKYADQYAEQGYVPTKVMLDNGWWLTCECGSSQVTVESAIVIGEKAYCEKCKPKDGEIMNIETVEYLAALGEIGEILFGGEDE